MIDQDKMWALAKCLRADADFAGERESGSFDLRYEADDVIDLLLAEVEAAAADKREMFALLPGSYYMDPPDGGDVSLIEQLRRMAKDAERYRLLRRGQHWSVLNGIGDTLRADELDAAIDAALAQRQGEGS
ncbi:TPA: hypothetical protein U2Q23_004709 [Burkholderia multivorans]|nr:hypothetical protein [Burkholderia multivorans]HEM7871821.1 hypothetical protein [Burkholderia multivorans]HEM7907382.1 hypothetical protein [Burkholderia multivorans]HEM8538547.1 hypothetical protein [Burkholderia multivorans]